MSRQQLDLFSSDEEPDLFGPDYAPKVYRADPDEVRADLTRLLAEARAAATLPWSSRKAGFYRTVFPQMASWLPAEEAAQLCFAFEEELKRLEAA